MGTHFATRLGARLIRPLLITVSLGLTGRLLWGARLAETPAPALFSGSRQCRRPGLSGHSHHGIAAHLLAAQHRGATIRSRVRQRFPQIGCSFGRRAALRMAGMVRHSDLTLASLPQAWRSGHYGIAAHLLAAQMIRSRVRCAGLLTCAQDLAQRKCPTA
jgi:hypothetical protein